MISKLKYTILFISIMFISSCTETDENECETKRVCFSDGTCIEQPTEDCFEF